MSLPAPSVDAEATYVWQIGQKLATARRIGDTVLADEIAEDLREWGESSPHRAIRDRVRRMLHSDSSAAAIAS